VQLHRNLGVTQKTKWHMFHRIREAMKDNFMGLNLSGTVEVDETYIGGKPRRHHRKPKGKKDQESSSRSLGRKRRSRESQTHKESEFQRITRHNQRRLIWLKLVPTVQGKAD